MYGKIKTPHLIPRLQTLPFHKPAHLQWAQDQGEAVSLTAFSQLFLMTSLRMLNYSNLII